jgi:hypothetical protein
MGLCWFVIVCTGIPPSNIIPEAAVDRTQVAMFWAFANSTCSLELASSSYGLILSFAQVGAFFGSTVATYAEVRFRFAHRHFMCTAVKVY